MSVETLSITHGQRTPEERADLDARLRALRQAFERIATPELREVVEQTLVVLSVGTPVELLQALVTPPAAETTAEPAWLPYLPLSIADFLEHEVTLEIWVRETQQTLFLGPAAIPGYLRSDDGEPARRVGVWTGDAMTQWLADAGVPEDERTVGRLLAVLKADVRGVRTR